ncbi:NADH-quinone oxidoreductase subunit N [Geomonas sp. Red32]|uniref:NADH-quinone oxidoreductase subunit N n=1 Tax=Geomonas sp. Red32 TaxID=2912856 RepID=UPI00202CA7D8|nr:NADH-quinone oxidoreductase subunit N [Geomonas sp. Red32]MCM0080939.1 NADH-quinone oxidoreductase subunit N [Geomonas sp. Red32]
MSVTDALAIMPILIAAGAALLVLLAGPFLQARSISWIAVVAAAAAGVWAVVYPAVGATVTLPGLAFTGLSQFLIPVFSAAATLTLLLSHDYNQRRGIKGEEFQATVLFTLFALCVLACATNLLILFLAIESVSFAFYILVSLDLEREESGEAGLKYLLMGAVAAAIVAFGISLIFAGTGTLALTGAFAPEATRPIVSAGWGLVVIGIAFKLSLVPAHLWTPDVYQGAPAPVAAFLSTGSKVAAAAFFLLLLAFSRPLAEIHLPLYLLSLGSMVIGNLAALLQKNIKRMLAYSSIAHMGYLALALLTGSREGYSAVLLYGAIYTAMNLAAFGAIASLSGAEERGELTAYTGLGHTAPFRGAILALAMLALAGIPPTAGFLGKFYIFYAAIRGGETTLAIIGIVTAAISAYFYLKVVVQLYMREPEGAAPAAPHQGTPAESLALTCAAVAILFIGIYPSPILRVLDAALR